MALALAIANLGSHDIANRIPWGCSTKQTFIEIQDDRNPDLWDFLKSILYYINRPRKGRNQFIQMDMTFNFMFWITVDANRLWLWL